jgi:diguanylate cyclase (GGDEF)-like protein
VDCRFAAEDEGVWPQHAVACDPAQTESLMFQTAAEMNSGPASGGARVEPRVAISETKAASAEGTATRPALLIVDDIAANRAILSRRFHSRGYRTVEAEGGLAALEMIEHGNFDLVLLDVMMPDMNGLEVLKRIRLQRSQLALPVIMVTALGDSDDVVRALQLGANDYVTKPVDFAVVCARVETQVGRKRAEEAVERANMALRQANEDLERRVAARTTELVETNERLLREIADRQRSEAKIEFLSQHDALTGLGNRARLSEGLDRALRDMDDPEESVAVFCIGLDHFKAVNDTLGHAAGDDLLVMVAGRLRTCALRTDIVARLGGDKFALVQGGLRRPEEAGSRAEHLIGTLREPYHMADQEVRIGASIGISVAPFDGTTADRLLRNSDLALNRAKAGGRGGCRFFERDMDLRAQARRMLEFDLQQAVHRNEFEVYYQPLVKIEDHEVIGFEALLRWQHPDRGMIPPAEFIPVAEELGVIVPLGEWVLRRACADAAGWPEPLAVAVNLSPVQFNDPDLASAVVRALDASGLPARRLVLEITESVLLQQSQHAVATLHRIRKLGVPISLDDFGTGYSSLSYLQSFPFDKIKIDQSFVRDVCRRRDCATIVRAVASLGLSLGMTTTAEGVETFEQLEQLKAMGCTEAQGFLFGVPMPAGAAKSWIDAFSQRRMQVASTALQGGRAAG